MKMRGACGHLCDMPMQRCHFVGRCHLIYLEDRAPGLGYVINNHGDCKSPIPVGPLPNGLFMSYKWKLLTTYPPSNPPTEIAGLFSRDKSPHWVYPFYKAGPDSASRWCGWCRSYLGTRLGGWGWGALGVENIKRRILKNGGDTVDGWNLAPVDR